MLLDDERMMAEDFLKVVKALGIASARIDAQQALLLALVATHPDRDNLHLIFGQLMSALIDNRADPEQSGVLQAFEDQVLHALPKTR